MKKEGNKADLYLIWSRVAWVLMAKLMKQPKTPYKTQGILEGFQQSLVG